MKYLILLCDGMADYPYDKLGGKTPMMLANKPFMDKLAKSSEVGLVKTVPDSLPAGSDVANLSVMGFDPEECYTGRSPLEAVGMGIKLLKDDISLRCNLVTLSKEENYGDKAMLDYCAGDISSAEAEELISFLNDRLPMKGARIYSGISYRHCFVMKDDGRDLGGLTPPHDISGKIIGEYLPKNGMLLSFMKLSCDLLKDHPVNLKRAAEGKNTADSIWFWGAGTAPKLQDFEQEFGVRVSAISAVDLIKGIAAASHMDFCAVEGATGYIDTNFEGKLCAAIGEFERGQELVYLHVEAPDECSHRGEHENKIKAIEMIDSQLLKPLLDYLDKYKDYKVMILPDHPTPLATRTHSKDAVPYLIYQKKAQASSGVTRFDEQSAKHTGNYLPKGCLLMRKLLK